MNINFILPAAFFLTGGAALLEEILWGRMLHRLLGSTSLAVATVVAGFLLGLAAGGALGGALAARLRRRHDPLKAYGAVEMAGGGAALCFTGILSSAQELAAGPWGPAALLGLLALFALPLGLGFPVAVAYIARTGDAAARPKRVNLLYGLNAFGGAAGAAAAGFWLIPALGESWVIYLAAALQAGVGALVVAAARRSESLEADSVLLNGEPAPPAEESSAPGAALYSLVFLSGLAALYWEVLWARILVLTVGSSVYALSLVTAGVLLGIGAGSLLFCRGPLHRRGFWLLPLLVAWLLVPVFYLVPYLADAYLFGVRSLGMTPWIWGSLGAGLVTAVPAFFTGTLFPWTVSLRPERSGSLLAASACGSALGAFMGGPWAPAAGGLEPAYAAGVLLAGLLTWCGAALAAGRPGPRYFIVAALALLPALLLFPLLLSPMGTGGGRWDLKRLLSGVYQWSDEDLYRTPHDEILKARQILVFEPGREVLVTVELDSEANTLYVRGNGKAEGSVPWDRAQPSRADLPTQALLGALPALLRPGASAAVIGLGSGVTLGAAFQMGLAPIDALEIEAGFRRALERAEVRSRFAPYLGGALESPEVRLHFGDARRLLSGELRDRKWPVVISQPSEPWVAAAAPLFTWEFFNLAAEHLEAGGLFVQWVQLYKLSPADLKLFLRTFRQVFNRVFLFRPPGTGELILIGALTPLSLQPLAAPLPQEKRGLLAEAGIRGPEDLLGAYLLGPEGLEAWLHHQPLFNPPLNTDSRNILEFHAPRFLHQGLDLARSNLKSLRLFGGSDAVTGYLLKDRLSPASIRRLAASNQACGDLREALVIIAGDPSPEGRALQKQIEEEQLQAAKENRTE
ncbi:MAG: hypothetical protein HY717_22210 [Planctomycetes bacterium]|nr:hypothetical protein [Planctomycetota bacterium]